MKIVIIGPFPPPQSGTTIKNAILASSLKPFASSIETINTKKNSFYILCKMIFLSFSKNENIIISVSSGGRKFLLPMAYILKKIFGKKVILLPCGGSLPQELSKMNPVQFMLYRFFYDSLARVFVEIKSMKVKLNHVLPNSNIEVMYNFKPRPKKPPVLAVNKTLKIIYLSRLRRDKGIFVLIKAVEFLKKNNINITLDFYGSFLPNDIVDHDLFKIKVEACDYINWPGFLSQEEINQYLQKYDMFIFPTFYKGEGFPGALIDAAYAGLPVIATNHAYNSEIVTNGKTGLLCRPNDVDSLAECIETLYQNPELRLEMGRNNYTLSQEFDAELAAKRIIDVFLNAA